MLVCDIYLAVTVIVLIYYHSRLRVNSEGRIAPELRKRPSRSHSHDIFAKGLRGLGVVINLLEVEFLEPVAVHGDVEIGGPVPSVLLDVHGIDGKLHSPVGHLALIAEYVRIRSRKRNAHQQVLRIFVVSVQGDVQAATEHRPVDSDIGL